MEKCFGCHLVRRRGVEEGFRDHMIWKGIAIVLR
jgi:hypothetical protein